MRSFLKLLSLTYREHRDKLFGPRAQPRNKPWMRYREIEVIQEVLQKLQPKTCLEWGAGYSTLFFPRALPYCERWLAVDHDEAWIRNLRALHPPGCVQLVHVAPNHQPWTDPFGDGAFDDLRDYIRYPKKYAPYDFILVDGRARNECLKMARQFIKPDGIVVLHDANRPHYHRETHHYPHQILLQGYRIKSGGVWIGSLERPITEVLDVAFHQAVWKLCRATGRAKIKC